VASLTVDFSSSEICDTIKPFFVTLLWGKATRNFSLGTGKQRQISVSISVLHTERNLVVTQWQGFCSGLRKSDEELRGFVQERNIKKW
jgi:hypothetical protein